MRMSAPAALASSSEPSEPGHAHHVAEAGEDHAGLVGERDAVVDPPHRDHAHRAAGPVDELDVGGQQVVEAVLVDRVRVPAAHLHHLVVTAGLDDREDLAGQRPAELGVAELVDEPHAIAVPAWTSTSSPGAGVHQRDLDRAALALGALAQRQAALLVDLDHPHRDGHVATGDAALRGAVGHSISDPLSSSSSCSYSAPIPLSSSSVAWRLLLVHLREREADVDEDPVTGSDPASGVGVQQSDVHVSLDSGDVNLRQPVVRVDHLDDAAWNGQAHRGLPSLGFLTRRNLLLCSERHNHVVRSVSSGPLRRPARRTSRGPPGWPASPRLAAFSGGVAGEDLLDRDLEHLAATACAGPP